MKAPLVDYRTENRIVFVTINRPEKRNALSPELISALKAAFIRAEKDEKGKLIVLRAVGNVFCAGADLAYLAKLQHFSPAENLADSQQLLELFKLVYEHPKVVIAQVEGHAIAGGCGLVTVCDFAFAVPKAKFGYTEVRIGFIPAIVSFFLTRKLGESLARKLLLSGELFPAEDAKAMGLVHFLSEADSIEMAVNDFARQLVEQNSADSMSLTKKLLAQAWDRPLREGLEWAAEMNAEARQTPDCIKGIAAFLNKEKLKW